jgi:hypothetical protein
MKAKIEVNKIHCERTSNEWFADEIYFGILVVSADVQNNEIHANDAAASLAKVSELRKKVKKGEAWKPEVNSFEVEVPDEGAFMMMLALYEKDDGENYEAMKNSFEAFSTPEKLDWGNVLKSAIGGVLKKENEENELGVTDIAELVGMATGSWKLVLAKVLFGAGKEIWKHLKKDDLLGIYEDVFDLNEASDLLPREVDFRLMRSKYKMSFQVTPM